MSTIVHYECRSQEHLRAGSRHGNGGLVIHHGSVGYCDGLHVDNAHRWVATGGLPIEFIVDAPSSIDTGTYRTDDDGLLHVRSLRDGRVRIEVDGGSRADHRVGPKLSEDPDWPDAEPSRMSFVTAD